MKTNLTFRPHHFLCALAFAGKGYSQPFIDNLAAIVTHLKNNEDTLIVVTDTLDAVCACCPNNQGTRCKQQRKVQRLDAQHAKALSLETGDVVRWRDIKKRMADTLLPQDIQTLCAQCSWRSLGLCEAAVQRNCDEH